MTNFIIKVDSTFPLEWEMISCPTCKQRSRLSWSITYLSFVPHLCHTALFSCLSFSSCLYMSVTLTSSHLWRGCRGCSFHRRPAEGGTQRWRGGSPTLSGHCTGWLCLICQGEEHKSLTAQINRTFVGITSNLTSSVIMIYTFKLHLMAPG